jgi:hypothetical protein
VAAKLAGSRNLVFKIDTGDQTLGVKAFAAQISAIARTLDAVKARNAARVQFEVVNITRNSPYTMTVREIPDPKAPTFSAVSALRKDLAAMAKAPVAKVAMAVQDDENRWDVVETYSEIIAAPQVLSISIGRRKIGREFIAKLKESILPNERAWGEVTGTLDAVDLHGKTVFWVFPKIGPKKVRCRAPLNTSIRAKVASSIEHYVSVYGELHYRAGDPFPFAIEKISDIEIHDPSRAPRLFDLRGIAPDLTGDKTVDEYLADARSW